MQSALLASALLMGLAGTPHCLAMCGAACAALGRQPAAAASFHGMRLLSYAAVGALAAGSVGLLATLGQLSPALKPLWTLVHAAALALGLWLLLYGRQPAWMENIGRSGGRGNAGGEHTINTPWKPLLRAGAAGALWPAWPCGLLQSALVVAALANTPATGAAVMAVFAAATSAGLLLGPALWWRLVGGRSGGGAAASARVSVWATRAAGAMLVAASAWTLGHGLWMRVAEWCTT